MPGPQKYTRGYNAHPAALDFDHLPGFEKLNHVSLLVNCSLDRLMAEIEKCEVVCALPPHSYSRKAGSTMDEPQTTTLDANTGDPATRINAILSRLHERIAQLEALAEKEN